MIAGQIASMAPDYLAAKVSAARCFAILDHEPEIDSYSTEGKKLVCSLLYHSSFQIYCQSKKSLKRYLYCVPKELGILAVDQYLFLDSRMFN